MIINYSAVELIHFIATKKLSPVEVMDAFITQIEKWNPSINAFVTFLPEQAREQAKKVEQALMRNQQVGSLYGLPVAIKDLTPTKGIRTTFGSPLFKDHLPDFDATVVKRIKQADGIIIGKTNTPEFGHKATTDNPLFGATKNPWDLSLTPGGSSGGSAAAISARMVPLAEGSDGGGSIRIPSSLSGVFGMKATYGRIPIDSNPSNWFGSQSPFIHYGPIARTSTDAALLYSVMKGYLSDDPFSLPDEKELLQEQGKASISDLKIAYTPNFGIYEVDTEVQRVCEEAVDQIRALGVVVEEVPLKIPMSVDEMLTFFKKGWFVGMAAGYGPLYEKYPEQFSDNIANMIKLGKTYSALEIKETEKERTKVWTAIQNTLNDYDLLLSPTLAYPAFDYRLEGPESINDIPITADSDWMMTQALNLTGHPAASMPVGWTKDQLPVGMQFIANRFKEQAIFRLAQQFEEKYRLERYLPKAMR